MTITDMIQLAGGVALFLYGMTIMGAGLEKVAGGKMQSILQKLTSSTIRGILLGTFITGIIQSSAGTIVIVIGLVNSGIMALPQAVGVIMGANIGTTVTGQLIRLADISGDSLLLTVIQPKTFSPVVAFVGMILYVFYKAPKKRNMGQIMMGFGILFTGMFQMESAVAGLRESELFVNLFTKLQNPVLGLLAGLAVTVAIQSSSASVGILQALSSTGVVTWGNAFPIILGTHIGTTFTPMVAAVGASKGAKRSAVIHLYFNLISSVVFLAGIYLIKCTIGVPFWNEILNKGSIANIHTLSSVVATICFIPFTKVLIWLAEHTVRDKPGEEQDLSMPVLDERLLTSPAVAIQQAQNAVEKMAARAARNYRAAMPLLAGYKDDAAAVVNQREDLIDRMEVTLTNYLIKISDRELGEMESHRVNSLLAFVTEVERIGDYAINVTERAAEMRDKELSFSDQAQRELQMLGDAIGEIIDLTVQAMHNGETVTAAQVEPLEETVDTICETLRTRHIQRLKEGKCQLESGIIFLDVLTNLERISDHCSNIAARLLGMESDSELDPHALKKAMHNGDTKGYDDALNQYRKKYLQVLAEG